MLEEIVNRHLIDVLGSYAVEKVEVSHKTRDIHLCLTNTKERVCLDDMNLAAETLAVIEDEIAIAYPSVGFVRSKRIEPAAMNVPLTSDLKLPYDRLLVWASYLLGAVFDAPMSQFTAIGGSVPFETVNITEAFSKVADDNEKKLIENVWQFISQNSQKGSDEGTKMELNLLDECARFFNVRRSDFISFLDPQVVSLAARLIANEDQVMETVLRPVEVASLVWHVLCRLCLETSLGIKHGAYALKLACGFAIDFGLLKDNASLLLLCIFRPVVNLCVGNDFRKQRALADSLLKRRKVLTWLKNNRVYDFYQSLKQGSPTDAVKKFAVDDRSLEGHSTFFVALVLASVDTKKFYAISLAVLFHRLRILRLRCKDPKNCGPLIKKQYDALYAFLEKFDEYLKTVCLVDVSQTDYPRQAPHIEIDQIKIFLELHGSLFLEMIQVLTAESAINLDALSKRSKQAVLKH